MQVFGCGKWKEQHDRLGSDEIAKTDTDLDNKDLDNIDRLFSFSRSFNSRMTQVVAASDRDERVYGGTPWVC